MSFIDNLQIKSKLIFSFSIIILLSGIGMLNAVDSLDKLNSKINFAIDNDMTVVVINQKIRRAAYQIRLYEMELNDTKSYDDQMSKVYMVRSAQDEISKEFDTISKLNLQHDTIKLVDSFKFEIFKFNELVNQVIKDIENHSDIDITKPSSEQINNSFEKILIASGYITTEQDNKFKQARDDTDDIFYEQIKISLVLILFIVLLAIFLAWANTISSGGRIINLIKTTHRISSGDLETKNTTLGNDEIGQLAEAIDSMQATLRQGNANIEQQNWLKTGIANINEVSLGQDNIQTLSTVIINEIATYISAGVATLYVTEQIENECFLSLMSSYAYSNHDDNPTQYKQGEGLVGQVALSRKPILLKNATEHYLKVASGINTSTPTNIFILPILYQNAIQGVLEIGTVAELSPTEIEYLTQATEVIAKAMEITLAQDKMRRQQIALTQANEKLTELDQMKTNFLSTVSHELRTPLTSVIGFARIMQKKFDSVLYPALVDNEDKKVMKAIRQVMDNTGIIVEEGERLTSLINNVLDLAKMEAGRVDWNIINLNIEEIIDRGIASTSSLFAVKPVLMVKKIPKNLPLCLGDHDRLIQVVINLISNAIKFTDEGSVTLTAELEADELIVSVIDSGTGIKAEDQALVFEKFKQVGDTMTDKPQGTGLGLPICKEIIEHLGGRIWVESKIGIGSTFSFSLPLSNKLQKPSNSFISGEQRYKNILLTNEGEEVSYIWQTDSAQLEQAIKNSLETANLQQEPEPSLPDILVIDDNLNIRQFLHQELSAANYIVREASSGAEGLAMIETKKPDLIILDVKMPHLNGFEVAVRLHTNPTTLHIPVILHTITEDQALGEQLGIDCYLNKPVQDSVLLDAVSHLLKVHASRKKILLFIADTDKRQRWINLLSQCGFEVMASANIKEGVESARAFDPQLVIAEIQLEHDFKIINQLRGDLGLDKVLFTLLSESTHI